MGFTDYVGSNFANFRALLMAEHLIQKRGSVSSIPGNGEVETGKTAAFTVAVASGAEGVRLYDSFPACAGGCGDEAGGSCAVCSAHGDEYRLHFFTYFLSTGRIPQ